MSKNLFNSVKMTKPGKSWFDLSHNHKLSCNMGELIPTLCMECVPGDKVNIGMESLLRMQPMLAPLMHNVTVTHHAFFVPNRLLWPNWEKFISPNSYGTVALPAFPTIKMDTADFYGRLANYLGVPTPIADKQEIVNAMPFAAYQMIYNEYYRDQNLIGESPFELSDGDNGPLIGSDITQLRRRAWGHDYFTSALPFAQAGAAVRIPIVMEDTPLRFNQPDTGAEIAIQTTADGAPLVGGVEVTAELTDDVPGSTYYAKTSEASAESTINDLRKAYRLQEWLEKAARAGRRYIETILGHFGVRSSDKRLQRPEYITGSKSTVAISEVLNTTGTDDAPQGNMAGHGVAVTNGYGGSYFCEEHGFIMCIMSVIPRTAYQQGLPKFFLKTNDPFQYYWPSFANIGEQEIKKKEIYAYQDEAGDETFGYTPRYSEYKFMNDRVSGDFQTSLSFWHLGRIFASPPLLNSAFISCNPRTDIFAVTDPDVQHLLVTCHFKLSALRPMPKYGTPTF